MKTPHIAHLTEEDYEHVYEPAEDSFILLDALEQDAAILGEMQPTVCVEIGSGSGVVSTFLSQLLHPIKVISLATDINEYACSASLRTAAINKVDLELVRCNLLDPYMQRLGGKIDVLVFNPPYVPTSTQEVQTTQAGKDIGGAWAGGQTGMDVTAHVLDMNLLTPIGQFYLIAVEQNDPQKILETLRSKRLYAEVSYRFP